LPDYRTNTVRPDDEIGHLLATIFKIQAREFVGLSDRTHRVSQNIVIARNERSERTIKMIPGNLHLGYRLPMRDAAVAVECDPLKRDNTDMGHMLAADGSQNGKYVSLAHQSGAAAGKPTY
jgi:hypothetical protein